MTKKLQEALQQQKQQTEQYNPPIYGSLGIPLGGQRLVEVPNRKSYVYVRLRDNQSETIQAYNNKVAPAYNLPVVLERQGNRYVVVNVDTQRYENNWNSFAPFLPRHGNTHSFDTESGGGGDIVWVYPRQFIPSMVMPSGSLGASNVFVNAYQLQSPSGTWKYTGNTGSPNITSYRPTSSTGAIMGLVYLDTVSGNPYLIINSGTVFSNSITGSSQIASYIPTVTNPATQIPLAAIRLITGTNILSWDNIYDIRQFLQTIPTGTGGGSSLTIQDEGVSQGTATTLNFVGDNVQATVSGGTARIFVTGSAGGGSINTGTLDARYLKLDASNDPITGQLIINVASTPDAGTALLVKSTDPNSSRQALSVIAASGSYGSSIFAANNTVEYLTQTLQGHQTPTNDESPLFIGRLGNSIYSNNVSYVPAILIYDNTSNANFYGGTIEHFISGSVSIYRANPQATGTVVPYRYDTMYSQPTGTIHSQWLVQGVEKARVDVSGTFYSNNVPLVKDAPVNSQPYVRKNAGWEVAGGWTLIQEIRLNFTGTFNFASIPQTYRHLKLQLAVRSNVASDNDPIKLRINGDNGNNYVGMLQWMIFPANTVSRTAQVTASAPMLISYSAGSTSPANYYSDSEVTFFDYASPKYPQWQSRGLDFENNTGQGIWVYDGGGMRLVLGAVTQIEIYPQGGTGYASGSYATLYGVS